MKWEIMKKWFDGCVGGVTDHKHFYFVIVGNEDLDEISLNCGG